MKDYSYLVQTALECGAYNACIIPTSAIVMNAEFRKICEANQCGLFGRCWVCPPACGSVETLMRKVRSCDFGLLYQTVNSLEDSFDIEGMRAAKEEFTRLNLRLRKRIPGAKLRLGAGGCTLCESCAKPLGKPCRHPELAMIPMEGCGIDVYNTTKATPLKYINGQNTVTYFALMLFSEDENA